MRIGLEAPNEARVLTAEEIERYRALGASVAKVRGYHPIGLLQQLLEINPDMLFLVRPDADGRIDPPTWLPQRVCDWLTERGCDWIMLLDSEQNHLNSPNRQRPIGDYARDLEVWAGVLRARWPRIKLCSPGLAVMQDDLEWLAALEPTYRRLALPYRGAHLYWQDDYHLSPDWGQRLARYSDYAPGNRWIVAEIGDSSVDASPAQRASRIGTVLRWLQGRGDVDAASIFISGGTSEWGKYILPPAELATIRAGLEESTTPPSPTPEVPSMASTAIATIGNNFSIVDRRPDLPTAGVYPRRQPRDVVGIAIHHSGVNVDPTADHALAAARYHIDQHGWPGIGYHVTFRKSPAGTWYPELCNDFSTASYHVAYRNHQLIGLMLPGNYNAREPEDALLACVREVVGEVQYQFGAFLPVEGHSTWAVAGQETDCPGLTSPRWIHKVQVKQPSAPKPAFVLGFADLARMLGAGIVGEPLEDEYRETVTLQHTSTGLMVWEGEGKPARFSRWAYR